MDDIPGLTVVAGPGDPIAGVTLVEPPQPPPTEEKEPDVPPIPTAILGATYAIPIRDLPRGWEKSAWIQSLTLVPKQNACSQGPPKPLITPFVRGTTLHLPRFWGMRRFGVHVDHRSLGDPIRDCITFNGQLCNTTPPQVQATSACVHQLQQIGGAMLNLPCGFGKTVCALWLIHHLGRKAAVVVASNALVEQWVQRIEYFLPGAEVGRIQGTVIDVFEKDIVIVMLQSLASKSYDPEMLQSFGTVVFDEAHHIAAPTFSKGIRKMPCRYVIGLSATPNRKDGCGDALYWFMGPEAYRAERVWELVTIKVVQYTKGDEEELIFKRTGKPKYAQMVNNLVADPVRHQLIVRTMSKYYQMGRYVLVLCDRRDQVQGLSEDIARVHPDLEVGVILPAQTKAAKGRIQVALTRQVIVSTYHYFAEGADVPRLDTLVLATPRGDVEQALGRILRPHPEKATPLVIDFWDNFSMFAGMMWKRFALYRKFNYDIERLTDNAFEGLPEPDDEQ